MIQTITAHRGASGYQHENTIAAFQTAIDMKANAIEFDVRRSKDAIYYIHHDEHINNQNCENLTYKEIWTLAKEKGYIIPTLEETLLFCRNRIHMDIELKEEGYEIDLIAFILKHIDKNQFFIRTFFDASIRIIKDRYPEITAGLLLGTGEPKHGFFTRLTELFPFFRIRRTKADFVSPHYRLLKLFFVKRMHLLHKKVYVWTVNDETAMKQILLGKNADGIVTDFPDIGLKILNN